MFESASSLLPLIDSFAFARDGFVLLRGCLPERLIDQHAAAVARYLLRCEPMCPGVQQPHREILRRRQAFHGRATGVLQLTQHERLLSPLNMLAGERSYLLGLGNLQGEQVLAACNACAGAPAYLSVWIAMRPIALEAGLKVVPGSHTRNRSCLRRLLAEEPEMAEQLRQMREEGASLERWREFEASLLARLRAQKALQAGQDMRLLALHKGDVLIQQQGLVSLATRVEGRSCLVAHYGAEQLHRNHYFTDADFAPA